jgi:acyl-CoA synthetase (AMP-forming)/AMP-acid ligase II
MICPLYKISLLHGEDSCLIENKFSYTYNDWNRQAQGIVDWLRKQSFKESSIIAIHHRTNFSTISWLFACARCKMILAILSDRDPIEMIETLKTQYRFQVIIDPSFPDPQPSETKIEHIDPTHPLNILFTSGSTGFPKAVVHCFANHWSSAKASNMNIPYQLGDRWLLSLSLWHIGGLAIIFRTLYGTATAISKNLNLSLNIQIQQDMITHLSVVTVQLVDILKNDFQLKHIKHILVGGGVIPSSLTQRSIAATLPIHKTYGMTELSSQLTTSPPFASYEELLSCGQALHNWQIKITAQGEICAKGPSLFLGYWDGEHINSKRDQNGFFHTKDTGYLKNGNLFPVGRLDQMFISGGENIQPEEIESILCEIVEAAIVVPIPHNRYTHRPVAFLKGNWRLKDIQRLLKNRLPSFKHPDHYFSWPNHISAHKSSRSQLQSLAISILSQQQDKNKQ